MVVGELASVWLLAKPTQTLTLTQILTLIVILTLARTKVDAARRRTLMSEEHEDEVRDGFNHQ